MLMLLLAPLLTSCLLGRAAVAIFRTPRRVPDKIQNPVRADARLAALWVGHATVLLQLDDKFVLTDPVFTSTVGVVSKRLVEPGIELSALPKLDAIVVSHMHFDHLSQTTLRELVPRSRALLLPEGGLVYVPNLAMPARELRRWESWEKEGLRITAVPVAHSGMRYGLDGMWRHDIGYSGWLVEYHGLRVWFGGDTTACSDCFRETAARSGPIDLALMPIAPVEPRGLMSRFHVGPVEALQAFVELKAKVMLPIHFETFVNAADEPGDATRLLLAERKRRGLPEESVALLRIGEQRVFVGRPSADGRASAASPGASSEGPSSSSPTPLR